MRFLVHPIACVFTVLLLLLCLLPMFAHAGDTSNNVPTRFGASLSFGKSYLAESDLGFFLGWGFIQWDHDAIWPLDAPEGLRFKAEMASGFTAWPFRRAILSAGVMTQYYIKDWEMESIKPYVEGGVHGIYTDFKLKDQGSRINFNPQLGIGFDFGSEQQYFLSLRLHHFSNADLLEENTGISSALLLFGVYF